MDSPSGTLAAGSEASQVCGAPATGTALRVRLGHAEPSGSWRSGRGAAAMRRAARLELGRLAARVGLEVASWPKDERGAPRSVPGGDGISWAWAVSHSRGLVAAGLWPRGAFGLDLEADDRTPSDHVVQRLRDLGVPTAELDHPDRVRAAWTRTEAVLKANGVGLGRLSDVRHRPAARPDPAPDSPDSSVEFAGLPFATRTLRVPGGCLTVAVPGSHVPPVELLSR